MKKCCRLNSILDAILDSRHVKVLSKQDFCHMLLKALTLLTATLRTDDTGGKILHQEVMGKYFYIVSGIQKGTHETVSQNRQDPNPHHDDNMDVPFALPAPGREGLLSFIENLLSSWFVRSASLQFRLNIISTDSLDKDSKKSDKNAVVVLDWRPLYKLLYRTCPKLDQFSTGSMPPNMSHSRRANILKKTANIVLMARHFFDQHNALDFYECGDIVEYNSLKLTDAASNAIWNLNLQDLRRTHSNLCFRAVVMLYLFLPWACTSDFFERVIPECLQCWSSIDRCNDFDFLWLQLLNRARFHDSAVQIDWTLVRKKILSSCAYWLQIPVTGTSNDRSFPTIRPMKSRQIPSFLKTLFSASSGGNAYQEGIEFVERLSSLLIFCVGRNDNKQDAQQIPFESCSNQLSDGTADLIRFLSFLGPYFNPTNEGVWTFPLGVLLAALCTQFARRLGNELGHSLLVDSYPDVAQEMKLHDHTWHGNIPTFEIPHILDALLPLVQQSIYSKNVFVGKAGEQALFTLSQISPRHVLPYFLDFAMRALDISAIHQSHQAPPALGVLTRLFQTTLRREPSEILRRTPTISTLILAGIDSNDRKKTILTLNLIHSIVTWVPLGPACIEKNESEKTKYCSSLAHHGYIDFTDGTLRLGHNLVERMSTIDQSAEFHRSLLSLPDGTLLHRPSPGEVRLDDDEKRFYVRENLFEASMVLGDWSTVFLARIHDLMRSAGKLEKVSKDHLGASVRHSASDANQAKSFSRLLLSCMIHLFLAMDDATHKKAVESVCQFISSETLPFSAKDVASLCTAACFGGGNHVSVYKGRNSNCFDSFDTLVPFLTKDLKNLPVRTATYRLRCLAGTVKYCGKAFANHRSEIDSAIQFCLEPRLPSDCIDKHLFKVGCKLLRHTVASQAEAYPLFEGCTPKTEVPGKSAELHDNPIKWHTPSSTQLDTSVELIDIFALRRLKNLLASSVHQSEEAERKIIISQWRETLKIVKYALRGVIGILADEVQPNSGFVDLCPIEKDIERLLSGISPKTHKIISGLRGKLCVLVTYMLSAIALETYEADEDTVGKSAFAPLCFDAKICKELAQISDILLSYRGSIQSAWGERTRSMERIEDELLTTKSSHIITSLERAGIWGTEHDSLMRDGEDAGRVISRTMLITKVWGFYLQLQGNASYEIPRRLRKERMQSRNLREKQIFFSANCTLADVYEFSTNHLDFSKSSSQTIDPLDAYDGLLDGLLSLSCHPKVHVRSYAMDILENGYNCFSFLARQRIPRLLRAISLDDAGMNGKFGVPCCSYLAEAPDGDSRRKRLAEVLKGVCSLLSKPRMIRHALASEQIRTYLIKTLCTTEKLLLLLPKEEIQKMVHFLQLIFSKFRQRWYSLPRFSSAERKSHRKCILFLINELDVTRNIGISDDSVSLSKKSSIFIEGASPDPNKMMHWRNQLLAVWFVTHLVDSDDLNQERLASRLWSITFALIEKHEGQPIQRASLGLLGRLVTFHHHSMSRLRGYSTRQVVGQNLLRENFCRSLCIALAFNHRQDSSIGGGHKAQWSAGVEDILRDSFLNLFPPIFYPCLRSDGVTSSDFKLTHAQVLLCMLSLADSKDALQICENFLIIAKELSHAEPSEDQKIKQTTVWEIFGAVLRFFLTTCERDPSKVEQLWGRSFSFFEEVLVPLPYELSSAAYDSVKFGIDCLAPHLYKPLLEWLISRINSSLWQSGEVKKVLKYENGNKESDLILDSKVRLEGFSSQSKWLRLSNAILNELRNETHIDRCSLGDTRLWDKICNKPRREHVASDDADHEIFQSISDKLLPLLLQAYGHPYEKCRSLIASSLYCICMLRNSTAWHYFAQGASKLASPTPMILHLAVPDCETSDFKERLNCLKTTKQLFLYSLHRGDVKNDYANLIIPLLPAAFSSLRISDDRGSISAPDRALEAEVANDFRYILSCIGSVFVTLSHTDVSQVLSELETLSKNETWHVRQAVAHYLRCFQGCHKFIFTFEESRWATKIVSSLLSDARREVSSAAMGAITGILAVTDIPTVSKLVETKLDVANRSIGKKKPKSTSPKNRNDGPKLISEKEKRRLIDQQSSVYFLCAAVLSRPYDTPTFVPLAIEALSRHSFENRAPLAVRETVKKCFSEFKRTHMTDNWEMHRQKFTLPQLEALEDVVSIPHYYA